MKICFIADARSPIARQWINYFVDRDNDVFVISSYPCGTDSIPGARVVGEPLCFTNLINRDSIADAREGRQHSRVRLEEMGRGVRNFLGKEQIAGAAMRTRNVLGPLELRRHVSRVRKLIEDFNPDLIHGMRIPFEGMIAGMAAPLNVPLLISVWGNDFTLHASQNPIIRHRTAATMRRADAILADCQRDVRLAHDWGFDPGKPASVLPGAGGIRAEIFYSGLPRPHISEELQIPAGVPVVINPRGLRGYVRNDSFFKAIPLVVRVHPSAHFLCVGLEGIAQVHQWIQQQGVQNHVRLLPVVPHEEMGELFRLSTVTVSPSNHDGTPNSLLEAMACGCFPVAGDIDSVREWIDPGVNGLLFDPAKPVEIAGAICTALENAELRSTAQVVNQELIRERAEYHRVMDRAESFYISLIEGHRQRQIAAT